MNWFSGLKNPFAGKSSSELESEKETELAKLSASYDEKIAAAKVKESAPAAVGTAAVGGRKTRRSKKGKSKRSRSGTKSSRL
jgi:hypothetical protein